MHPRSICAAGGAVVAAVAIAACGSFESPGVVTATRITRDSSVVYQWGRTGGGLINPGRNATRYFSVSATSL